MKIKTIATIFKRGKFLRIYTMPNGEQWIGNGAAFYKMSGMPQLTPAVVLKIFDIPENKQAEWNCESGDMPERLHGLFNDDFYKTEQLLESMKVSIDWRGVTLIFVKNQNDIFAIDEKFVKPLYDDVDYLQFVKRTFGNGKEAAIACYNALELQAIIMPCRISDDLTDELKIITAYFSSYRYEQFVKGLSPKPNIDPETGEVLDKSGES